MGRLALSTGRLQGLRLWVHTAACPLSLALWGVPTTQYAAAISSSSTWQPLTGLTATSFFLLVAVAQIWTLLVRATPESKSLDRLLAFLHVYVGLIIMPVLNDVIPAPGMEALSMPYLPGSVINTCWGMLEGFEPGSQLLGAVAVVPSYAALQLHREWRAWSAQPGPGEGQVDHPTNPGLSWTLARYLQLLLLYAVVNVIAVVALNMQALQAGPSRQAVATASSYSLPPLPTPYSDAPHSAGSSSAGSWACRLCSRLDAWDAAVGATLGRLLAWCDPDLCLVAVCGPVAALSWFAAAHALHRGKQPCTVHAMTASAGITAALMLSGVDRNKLVRSASQARQLLDDLLPSHIVSALLEAHTLPALNWAAPQALQPPATHHFDSSLDTSRHPSFVSIGNSTTSQTVAPLAASLLSCDKLSQGAAAGDAVPGNSGSGSAGLSQQLSQPQLPPGQPTHLRRTSSSHQFSSAPVPFLLCPKGSTKEQSSMQSGAWGLSPLAKVCGSMPRPPVVPGVAPSEQATGQCSLSWDDSSSGTPDHGQVATISDWVWSEHPCETLLTAQPIPAIRSAAAEPVLLLPGSEHHGSNVSEPRSSETGGMSGFFRRLTSSGLNVAPSSSGSSLPTPSFLMAPTLRDLTNMTSLPSRLGHQGTSVASSHHAYGPHSNPALSNSMATRHPSVSVLFADIVGFSTVSQEVEPEQVFAMLNELYARYDSICETMPSLYKIETIGDAYMVAAGLLLHDADHAATMLRFALAMQQAAGQVQMPTGTGPVRIRVGIHSGPVTSGIIGKIRKRYCLVGNTVNTASRMESCGLPGRIHVSSSTHQLVAGSHPEFVWECRGPLDIKGLGSMVTYLLADPNPPCSI